MSDVKTSSKVVACAVLSLVVALAIGLTGRQALQKNLDGMQDVAMNRLPSIYGLAEMDPGQLHVTVGMIGLAVTAYQDPAIRRRRWSR